MTKRKQLRPMEVRTISASQFRATSANNQMHVSGYVNKTGQPSDPIPNMGEVPTDSDIPGNDPDSFIEIMEPGVFKNALQNADFVDFLYEHEPKDYLASTKDGSMSLAEDSTGLKMSANITPTSWGKDAFTLIKSGAIAGMSFGFIVLNDDWDLSGATPVRTVTQIQLFEVSAVRFPAYPSSTIEARRKYMKRLNAKLEKRGFTIPRVFIPKQRRESSMYKNNIEKRANSNTSSALNSADANTIAQALGQVQNSLDNLTNAVQTNSEVQSNIADQIMQAANSERAKKTKHSKVSTDAKKRAAKAKKRACGAKKRDDDATASDVASDESESDDDTDEDDLDTDAKKSKASTNSKKRSGKAKKRDDDDTDVDTDAKKSKAKTDAKKRADKKSKSHRSKVTKMMANLNAMEKH